MIKLLAYRFHHPLILLLLAPLPVLASVEPACITPQQQAAIAAPRDALQAANTGVEADTDLTPAQQRAISGLKQAVAEFADAQLNCLPGSKPDLPKLTAALTAAAGSDTITFEPALSADGELLALVARIGIPCGSDAQLLLYAPQPAGGWRRVLRWVSADYARVDGAWEAFQYRIAPPDADGQRRVAAAHIRPWCSSTWSSIDYAVLRPVSGSDKPAVVFKGSDSLWWGGEDFGRLSLDATHFELRFHAASVDSGVHNREFIRRYDLSGAAPRRVQPVAVSAQDFVDEWTVSPWASAKLWTAAPRAVALQARHAQLHALRKSHSAFEFGKVSTCPGADSVQVELRNDDEQAAFFFRVDGKTLFTLSDVSDESDPQCSDVPTGS